MAVAQIRQQRGTRGGTPPQAVVEYVPLPPSDSEKFLYYGRQGRWIFCVFLLAFAGVMFGLARLAANSMWTSLLYELIALQVVAVLISLLSSTRKRRSSRAEHESLVAAYRPAEYPSVDVFLPSAGESPAILDNTFRNVARHSCADARSRSRDGRCFCHTKRTASSHQ